MTRYTDQELRREAVSAIHEDARAAKVKARCIGWTLELHEYNGGPSVTATLVALGERLPNYTRFDVRVAI